MIRQHAARLCRFTQVAVATALCAALASGACADVFGRLRFSVKNAADEKPLKGAKVRLHDTANVRSDVTLTTDDTGSVTSPLLENRAWQITTEAELYQPDTRDVSVAADTTTDVEVLLEPLKEQVIRITGARQIIQRGQTADSTRRDLSFFAKFPVAASNPQSLSKALRSNPGFVEDSVNQIHPRGEHSHTSIYINGFALPGVLQGRAGPLIVPEAIQSLEALTGAYAPEYGRETAAILNLNLRAGTLTPFQSFSFEGGSFSTYDGVFTAGGQAGGPFLPREPGGTVPPPPQSGSPSPPAIPGAPPANGEPTTPSVPKTENQPATPGTPPATSEPATPTAPPAAGEPNAPAAPPATREPGIPGAAPPSGEPTTPGQAAVLQSVARRFSYLVNLTRRTTANALEPPQPDRQTAHNAGGANTGFGNFQYRAGSRDELGLIVNTAPANTEIANRTGLPARFASVGQGFGFGGDLSAEQAAAMGIVSQQAAGQDIFQKDTNEFGVLQWRHTFTRQLTGLLSFGVTHPGLETRNNNPAVNVLSLPADNSIEFNPTIKRNATEPQAQGSLTFARSRHTYKAGFQLVQERGSESYQFIPASQKALDALAQLDPRLAPAGSFQDDGMGGQKFVVDPNNPAVPTLRVRRRGFYRAAYLQDTWGVTKRLTANYGVRLDSYRQRQNLAKAPVTLTQLSPRLNFAYLVAPLTIARLSYNHLFIEPPLSQGAIIGQPIRPETLDQYEASLERQIGSGQTVKVAYYYKDIRNQIDTALLISRTQIGAYASRNLQFDGVHAFELSYELAPRGNVGPSAYLAYAYGTNRPSGKDNTGEPVEPFNDHDQRDTLSTGFAYTLPSGAAAGINFYYGSGVFSSTVGEDAPRTPRTEFNLRLTSGPRLFAGHGGLTLNVDNLFNQRKVINFQSDFSGTRFQQGRRVLFSAFGRF